MIPSLPLKESFLRQHRTHARALPCNFTSCASLSFLRLFFLLFCAPTPHTPQRHIHRNGKRKRNMANYKYISPDELVELLDRPDSFHKVVVVDCRDADRDSGFIANSINAPTMSYTTEKYEQLAKQLFEEGKEIAVFHCAQSLIRGPKGANRFAMAQRAKGYSLPVVYVLRGGWDEFYDIYGDIRPDLIYV